MNCYVLTGGRSTRMGRSKSDLFLGRIVEAAAPVFDRVIAVQRFGQPPASIETIFEDEHEGEAPIFGVIRALEHAQEKCFVLATDLPLITTALLRELRTRFERVPFLVARWQGEIQPLCAGYPPALIPLMRQRVGEGKLDLRGLFDGSAEVVEVAGDELTNVNTMNDFSHLDETGGISMVDVSTKMTTAREAVASATVRMSKETLRKLIDRALPKGDVLNTAKVAGVLGAKQTPSLIPLTHTVAINSVDITFDLDPANGTIEIRAIVRCDGKTGVEIEAMTACAVAALTIYDMCKSAEKGIVIENVQLVRKSGGKSGLWERS